jgi:SAM-dependent methyltransferase
MVDDGLRAPPPTPDDAHRSLSFGSVAQAYDRYRPSFPAEARTRALGVRRLDVVEVGAGTGLMTEVLLRLGHRVIAVEPDAHMRERMPERAPGAVVEEGNAESLPIGDASQDAVVAAESFHWFDKRRALPEFGRVLRAHGRLVIVWHVSDESVRWVNDFHRLLDRVHPAKPGGSGREVDVEPWFTIADERRFAYAHRTDADGLVGLAGTWSPIIVSPRRDEVLAEIGSFATSHPDLAGKPSFAFPLLTRVVVCRRPSDDGTADAGP